MPVRHLSGCVLEKEHVRVVRAGDVVLYMYILAKSLERKRQPWTMNIGKGNIARGKVRNSAKG